MINMDSLDSFAQAPVENHVILKVRNRPRAKVFKPHVLKTSLPAETGILSQCPESRFRRFNDPRGGFRIISRNKIPNFPKLILYAGRDNEPTDQPEPFLSASPTGGRLPRHPGLLRDQAGQCFRANAPPKPHPFAGFCAAGLPDPPSAGATRRGSPHSRSDRARS